MQWIIQLSYVSCKRRNSISHSTSDRSIHRDSAKILLRPHNFFLRSIQKPFRRSHTHTHTKREKFCVCDFHSNIASTKKRDANLNISLSSENTTKIYPLNYVIPDKREQKRTFPGFCHILLRKFRKNLHFFFVRKIFVCVTTVMHSRHTHTTKKYPSILKRGMRMWSLRLLHFPLRKS